MHWRRISDEKCSSFVIDIHTNYERISQDNGIQRQLNSNFDSFKTSSYIWLPPTPSVGSVDQQDNHADQRFPTELLELGAASLFPADVCGDTSSGISSMKSDLTGTREHPSLFQEGPFQSGSSDRSDTGYQDSFDDRTEDTDCESFATESTPYFNAAPKPAALRIHNNLHREASSAKPWSCNGSQDEFRQCAKLDDLIRSAKKFSFIDKRVSSRRWNECVRGTSSSYHGTSSDISFSGYDSRAQRDTETTRSVSCARGDTPQPSGCEYSSLNTGIQNVSPLFLSSHHDLFQGEITIRDEQSSAKPHRSVSLPNIYVCSANQLKQNDSKHSEKSTFDAIIRFREQYIWRSYVKRRGVTPRILPYRLKCKMNTPDTLDFEDDEKAYNQGEMRRKRKFDLELKIQREAVVHDPIQTDASSTTSLFESSLVPTGRRLHMPNPSNKINHKLHSTLHCPCFLFFCFLCCYPAVFLMQKSDAHFISGDDNLARKSAKRATSLYIIGAVCSVSFLSVMLFLVFYFLGI